MDYVLYTERPTTIKAYQFDIEKADEFIKMLWNWNYLTRLTSRKLVFQAAGQTPMGKVDPVYRMYHGDYLIETTGGDDVWKIEVMSSVEFEKKYIPVPQEGGME